MSAWCKDVDAVLDWAFNWTEWLGDNQILTSVVVTVETGLVEESHAFTPEGVVTVWLSGGTAGESYEVACLITTSKGRTDERTRRIDVLER